MIRTIIAFLLLTTASLAGTCVAVKTNNGSAGTCAVIYQHKNGVYVAMTAKHVVADATSVYLSVGEKWEKASKFYSIKDLDASFIEFSSPDQKLKPFPIGYDDPAPGDTVQFVGFAYGNDWVEGKQEGVVASDIGRAVQADYPPYKGQSGGAVLDAERRVVGVVSATSPNTLHYVPVGQIREACIRYWGVWWGPRCCPQPRVPAAPYPDSPSPPPPYQRPTPQPQSPTPRPEDDVPESIPVPIAPKPEAESPPSAEVESLKSMLIQLTLELNKLKNMETPIRVRRKSDGVVISEEKVKLAQGQPINLDLDDKTMEELRKLLGK